MSLMKKVFVFLGFIFFLSPNLSVQAFPLYLDLNVSMSKDKVSGLTSPPTLYQYSGGLCLAYSWYDWLFTGVSADYELVNQHSTVDASVGNFRGTRQNITSPTLGFKYWLILKVDLQFFGNYQFANTTASGAKLSLKSPFGFRVSMSAPIWSNFYLGALYEQISYSKQNNSSIGDSTLSPKTKFSNLGLTLTFIPWGSGAGDSYGSYY